MGWRHQGINYSIINQDHDAKMMAYKSVLLQDLVGNAFHSGCAIAVLLAMFCAVGQALVARDGTPLPKSAAALAGVQTEDVGMSTTDAHALLDSLCV